MSLGASIASLGSAVQRWTFLALAALLYSLALIVGSCSYGRHIESNARDAQALRLERAQAAADAQARAKARLLDQQLTQRAAQADAQARDQTLRLHLEVPRVIAQIVPAQSAARYPLPAAGMDEAADCVLTADARRLWNDALRAGSPSAAELDAHQIPGADTPGGATLEAALHNHIDNAGRCSAIERKLDALIDWHLQTQGQEEK